MSWWKKQEEADEGPKIPVPVSVALNVLDMFEHRPGKVTKSQKRSQVDGIDYAKHTQEDSDYLEAPTALTQEQKNLQAAACMVVNSYLSSYLAEVMAPSEDV